MEKKELNGWLNVDKPLNYSSAKVVAIIKKILNVKKVGHGGTLDPLATGVLPIAINKATKSAEKMMNFDKEYLFEITFGEQRTTDDSEGEVIGTSKKMPTSNEIIAILPNFIGDIKQVPPIYSAIKINGQRAYDLARSNKSVELKERNVKVFDLSFLGFTSEKTGKFSVKCGKGFYVRSLGIDLAKSLGTLGYISCLRRISVGPFDQGNILTIEKIKEINDNDSVDKNLIMI